MGKKEEKGELVTKSFTTPTICQLQSRFFITWPTGSVKPITFAADSFTSMAEESPGYSSVLMSRPFKTFKPFVLAKSLSVKYMPAFNLGEPGFLPCHS